MRRPMGPRQLLPCRVPALAAALKKRARPRPPFPPSQVRCSRHLYTLCVADADKAEKLKQSLPPGEERRRLGASLLLWAGPCFVSCSLRVEPGGRGGDAAWRAPWAPLVPPFEAGRPAGLIAHCAGRAAARPGPF